MDWPTSSSAGLGLNSGFLRSRQLCQVDGSELSHRQKLYSRSRSTRNDKPGAGPGLVVGAGPGSGVRLHLPWNLLLLLLFKHRSEDTTHTLNVATKTTQVVASGPRVIGRCKDGGGSSQAGQYPGHQCLASCQDCAHASFCSGCRLLTVHDDALPQRYVYRKQASSR